MEAAIVIRFTRIGIPCAKTVQLARINEADDGDNSGLVREELRRGSSQENMEFLAMVWISHVDTPGSPRSALSRSTAWECRYHRYPIFLKFGD